MKDAVFKFFPCAFCRGSGKDPFGVMSPLSACQVCGGKKRIKILEPCVECAYCGGSGIFPTQRLTCTVCRGKGCVNVNNSPYKECPSCNGKGVKFAQYLPCLKCRGKGVISKSKVHR